MSGYHAGCPVLETARTRLRLTIAIDADGFGQLLRDPEGRRFTGGVVERSVAELAAALARRAGRFSLDPARLAASEAECFFTVESKESAAYLGYAGFQFCDTLGEIEIMYGYRREFWGQGYGGEVARALVDWGFDSLGLPAIHAAVNPANPASERILLTAGLRFLEWIDWPGQGPVKKYGLSREKAGARNRATGKED